MSEAGWEHYDMDPLRRDTEALLAELEEHE